MQSGALSKRDAGKHAFKKIEPKLNKRNHLIRLPAEAYRGDTAVHWSLTMKGRRQGWLNPIFLYRFRELLTHTAFRYGIVCPIYCLMPDHFHMVWMGLFKESDQLLGMKHFRKTLNESLQRVDFKLQDPLRRTVALRLLRTNGGAAGAFAVGFFKQHLAKPDVAGCDFYPLVVFDVFEG